MMAACAASCSFDSPPPQLERLMLDTHDPIADHIQWSHRRRIFPDLSITIIPCDEWNGASGPPNVFNTWRIQMIMNTIGYADSFECSSC